MRFSIISEIPGRTRLQLAGPVPESDLDALLKLSGDIDGVHKVRVYGRIGQMALEYDEPRRASVLDALGALDAQAIADAKSGYVMQLEPRKHKLVMDLATLVGVHYARRWFLPTPLRAVFVVAGYMAFLRAALHELAQPRLTVPVLDASAIGISFVKRDVDTAGQTMFLLNVGELLEDYTRAMSENELINSLLDVPDKAQKVVGDTEVSVAATELEPGDLVAVRTGMSICIDGVVEQGSAMVNQATLTGEPLAVERSVGDDVFAGTVVEDGSILVRVRANTAQTKLRSIVSLVQTADSLKSEGQSHMEDLANKIVPWNFLLAGLVALTTRSLIKTSAALMVDYSCALKLTGSAPSMTAMSDAAKIGRHGQRARSTLSRLPRPIPLSLIDRHTHRGAAASSLRAHDRWLERGRGPAPFCLPGGAFPASGGACRGQRCPRARARAPRASRCGRVYCGARHRLVH